MRRKVEVRVRPIFFLWLGVASLAFAAAPKETHKPSPTEASALTLSAFLSEVRENHDGLKGLEAGSKSAVARAEEAKNAYVVNLFVDTRMSDDYRQTMNPSFQGSRTIYDSVSLGISKMTSFGLAGRLYFMGSYTQLQGTNGAFVPEPTFFEARPVLEVSQSFFRNGFGSETRAQVEAVEAATRAQSHQNLFQTQMILAEAEGVYWRLQVAREALAVQKESLERAGKIRDWNARRARLSLADKSDLFQSEAGYKGRELEVRAAEDQLLAVARKFNSLRGRDSAEVPEKLESLSLAPIKNMKLPEKAPMRNDVLAAEFMRQATAANLQLGLERNKPNLDLKLMLSLNGRDPSFGTSAAESFGTRYPWWGVEMNFKTPLNFGAASDFRAAYVKEQQGAELQYRRKIFDQDREWTDLNVRLEDAKRRLGIAEELEAIQKRKLDHERDRLKRGQSVTYQVLLFEQDYLGSQILRLRTLEEILGLAAQIKIFGGVS